MARSRLNVIAALVCLAALLYLLWGLRAPYGFIASLRGTRLAALVLVGASVGVATALFQTVTQNRLLTPGIVGFDSMFVLIQTVLVLLLGGAGYAQLPEVPQFLIEAGCLALAGSALFGLVLRRGADDMTRLVLTGVILGILMRGLANFLQRVLEPSEFAIVQQASFASFTSVDPLRLAIAAPLFIGLMVLAMRLAEALDVAALGRVQARALGLDHDRLVLAALAIVALLVAISTALAGPMTFLGLLATALASALLGTHRHRLLIPASALLGALILIAGQFLFERVLGLQSTLAVMVEFFGGLTFLFLVLTGRSR